MNNVSVSGRLVRDPECKEFDDGKMVCDFTLAINGYKKEDTVFVKIKAWAARAKSCAEFCKKGSLVNVAGGLRANSWTAKDGSKKREIYILASDVEFVQLSGETKNNESASSSPSESPAPVERVSEEDLEKVPF
jgi:single-strand DNA-binding protein